MAYTSKSDDAIAEIASEIEDIKNKKREKQLVVEGSNDDIPEEN